MYIRTGTTAVKAVNITKYPTCGTAAVYFLKTTAQNAHRRTKRQKDIHIATKGQKRKYGQIRRHRKETMIIQKLFLGEKGDNIYYAICADKKETGADLKPCAPEIARFESIEDAAIVLKYLRGDFLSREDTDRAKENLRQIDGI